MDQEPYINSSTATFLEDAVEASHRQLVMVDFWAAWCGPCQSLAPVLEKLALAYQGSVKLVKVDTDREQALAAQFGIRSLPTVLFLKDGKVVDQFMGALPESNIRQRINQYVTSSIEKSMTEARDLYESGQPDAAKAILNRLWQSQPDDDAPKLQLLAWLTAEGNLEEADRVAQSVSEEGQQSPEYKSLQTTLEFRQESNPADRTGLEASLTGEPENLELRYRLAKLLIAERQYAAAMDHLLEIIRRDRSFMDDGARKTMLKVFDILGNKGDLVSEYRTRLSRMIF